MFTERNSPEKSSALSYNGEVTYTILVNSFIPPVALTSKLKLFFLLMTQFNNRWTHFTDISQLTHTYAQTDNSRSIEDVAFLALTVLSLIPSLDSYTVRGKQNLT